MRSLFLLPSQNETRVEGGFHHWRMRMPFSKLVDCHRSVSQDNLLPVGWSCCMALAFFYQKIQTAKTSRWLEDLIITVGTTFRFSHWWRQQTENQPLENLLACSSLFFEFPSFLSFISLRSISFKAILTNMASNRRLTKELDDIGKDPVEGFMVGPVDDDIFHWQAMLDGPVRVIASFFFLYTYLCSLIFHRHCWSPLSIFSTFFTFSINYSSLKLHMREVSLKSM